jgi:phenylalanyl-tRNA synthetase alpha chain
MSLLTREALARDLAIPDLTTEAPHALALMVTCITDALAGAWGPAVRTHVVRAAPIVSTDDNYDRLGFAPDAVTRDARYSRYVSETCLLRTHTSALIPPALRRLAADADGWSDVLLACPGLVYRRDAIDRLHTGTPHQLDLWRISSAASLGDDDLRRMIAVIVAAALPGLEHRCIPAEHPYTEHGLQIDVLAAGEWVEVGECGLAAPRVLAGAGLPVPPVTGLAMGLGLDRLVMLRKGIDDIRLLRSPDERVAAQLRDLDTPYRPVSNHPSIRRDVSIAVDLDVGDEELGDRVRDALGPDSDCVESVAILSSTALEDLPSAAIERLGIGPGQRNVLLRIVLRHVDRTLTDAEANALRDRIFTAVHQPICAPIPSRIEGIGAQNGEGADG